MAAFVALDRLYPLYTGEHLFEIRPGLRQASDVGANDFTNDDMVARLAQTEAMKIKRRDVPRKPARKNVWVPLLQQYRDIPAKPARKTVKVLPLKALKEMV